MKLREYFRINVWLLPLVGILIPFLMLLFGSTYMTTPNKYNNVSIEDGWSVRHGDYSKDNVTLSDVNIGTTMKGDIVIISNRIPDEYIPAACIMFRSLLSTVSVKIDGEMVYQYGQYYKDNNLLLPKHYNFITISDEQLGTKLEITFEVTEDKAFTGLSSVNYGNRVELERSFLQSKRLDFFIGVFLCVFGFMLLTLSSYLYMYHGRDVSLVFSSIISFVLGAYSLSYNDLFCFISDNDFYFNILEYVSLYFVPFAIIVFLVSTHNELKSNITLIFIAVNILFPLITLGLQIFNIVHINVFVSTLHIIAIAEAAILVPLLVISIHKQYLSFKDAPEFSGMTAESVLIIGLVLFILCCVIDIVKYNLFKSFGHGGEAYLHIGFMTIGTLCFVISLFMFYFYHGIEHMNDAYVREPLEGLAYTDALTGLMNRAKCMQYMASVHGNYAIISLDLDNLKPVNDSLGHIEGDRMIKSFAALLKDTFECASLIGRTGGDEFLVAIENPEPGVCQDLIDELEEKMEKFNKNERTINLSASSGYAYSSEVKGDDSNAVYILADSRMYKVKERHHSRKMNRIMNDLLSAIDSSSGGADHA